jgi:UDP-N-acetylglucosamine pyrophosphorylase
MATFEFSSQQQNYEGFQLSRKNMAGPGSDLDLVFITSANTTITNAEYLQLEEAGVKEAGKAAFVLVAGGLGERLGYSGVRGWGEDKSMSIK